jgi:anaerobic magnesium-protoporphyrin IX monomethyl ester cyclase
VALAAEVVVSTLPRVLLINPTITSRKSARFPLAILSLAHGLDGRYDTAIVDGNVDRDFIGTTTRMLREQSFDAVGITVMGGPQLPSAIGVSNAIRALRPALPIIWGGYFPTMCAVPAIRSPYVDFVVRGQGEDTVIELLDTLGRGERTHFDAIPNLTWRRGEELVHNPDRKFSVARLDASLPYHRLTRPQQYLGRTYLGNRTAGYQAALGCRFRCTFCGVATMFRGKTAVPQSERVERDLTYFTRELGVNALQFYDNNFFDREVDMEPLLATLAKFELPWWCFARSDALLNMSAKSWALVRKSQLRMAYIGAESPSDELLHDIRKGTRADQTIEVVHKCRENGVIPELSFMLAPPQDPEGETERTFEFIRTIKRMHPLTEVMIYIYTPLAPSHDSARHRPARSGAELRDVDGEPVVFPATADEWAEPEWIDYWCHQNAPWVTKRLRQRIVDFTTVLGCRFPTITDIRSPSWAKSTLRNLAAWRYRYRKYGRPIELDLSRRFVKLWDPRVSGL